MAISSSKKKKHQTKPKKQLTAEVYFAQKLAANEKKIRDKTIKKLRKWLTARSSVANASLNEEEMLKLWKGLFYCMWMSDKPLVQEELAETIAQLIHVLQNRDLGLLFLKVALITLGREWMNIDKWRMDKFLLFGRRIVRHGFKYLAANDWDMDEVNKVAEMVSNNVINANKNVTDIRISLGIQSHVTDIWLEELAKVGGEEVPEEVVLALLEPYIQCVVKTSDFRLKDVVRKRVFFYLMRQSDVGIEYELGKQGIVLDDEDDEAEAEENSNDETEEEVENEEEAEDEEEEGEDLEGAEYEDEELEEEDGEEEEEEGNEEQADGADEHEEHAGMVHEDQDGGEDDEDPIVDPRAGGVDVTLPQLQLDYNALADRLFEVASHPEVRAKNRKFVYELVKKFKDLAAGVYPLAIAPVDVGEGITRSEIHKAVYSVVREEKKYLEKNRREKLAIRAQKKIANKANPATTEENTPVNFTEATMSKRAAKRAAKRLRQAQALKPEEPEPKKVKKSKKQETEDEVEEDNEHEGDKRNNEDKIVEAEARLPQVATESGKKKRKAKNKKSLELKVNQSVNENNSVAEDDMNGDEDVLSAMETSNSAVFEADEDWGADSSQIQLEDGNEGEKTAVEKAAVSSSTLKASLKRKNKQKKKGGESAVQQGWTESLLPGETEIVLPNKRYKGPVRLSPGKAAPPTTPSNAAKKTKAKRDSTSPKKVIFALSSSAQEPHEYADAVRKSPAVPHDPQRKPVQGVLKTSASTTGRAVAADFF